MKKYLNKLHYNKNSDFKDKLLLIFLFPISLFYFLIINIRNFLYNFKIIKTNKLNAFVISVGNLTTGGTGKTPVTCAMASWIRENTGQKTAVISRGYGGKLSVNNINIISDGKNIFFDAENAGDEPFWIAENSKETVVITGKNRIGSGKYAVEKLKSRVLILDDGFQHRKLNRDINILLIDSENFFGNNLLLPAGPLREPLNEVKRADKVIIVNKNQKNETFKNRVTFLQEKLKDKYGKDSVVCNLLPDEIYNISTKQTLKEIKNVVAFTGIAQPESFFGLLTNTGINIADKFVFSDHYMYTEKDIKTIINSSCVCNVDAVITTEKDSVKIQPFLSRLETKIPVCALKLKADLNIREIIGSSLKITENNWEK